MREEGEEISGRHERGDPSGSEPQAKQAHALDPLFHYFDLESSKEASKRPKFPSWLLSFLAADLDIPPLDEMVIEISHRQEPPRRLGDARMVDGGFDSMGAGLGEQLEAVAQWRLARWVLGKGGVLLKSLKA
ncbi:hypothetical protein GQ457_04G021730 [Hibiscus cannabinus]